MREKIEEDSTKNIDQQNINYKEKITISKSEKTYIVFRKDALEMQK
jgi:hypothetical protein